MSSLKLAILFLCSVCMIVPIHTDAFQDSGCNNTNAACIEEPNNILKIKRMSDVDLGEWQGQPSKTASSGGTSGGLNLCILAASVHKVFSKRKARDYTVELNGRHSVLRNQGRSSIPVTLRLIGQGEGTAGIRHDFVNGSVLIRGNDNYTVCRNYEFRIEAEVLLRDIITNAQSGYYQGIFSLQVTELQPFRSLRSPEFIVSLYINAVTQVTQLKDVIIKATNAVNGKFSTTMDFCVFALDSTAYKLRLETQNNYNRKFHLLDNNSRNPLPYQVKFSSFGVRAEVFKQAGYTSHFHFGHRQLNCGGTTNASINIEVQARQAIQAPMGVYQDVMKITVEPL